MPTLKEKSQLTRAKLVQAALTVFSRKGYEAAIIDEIVKKAGVSKGAFYYHFTSKEAMFVAVVALFEADEEKRLKKLHRVFTSRIDFLNRLIKYFSTGNTAFLMEYRTIAERTRGQAYRHWRQFLRVRRSWFEQLLTQVKRQQLIRSDCNVVICAQVLDTISLGLACEFDPQHQTVVLTAARVTIWEMLGMAGDTLTETQRRC